MIPIVWQITLVLLVLVLAVCWLGAWSRRDKLVRWSLIGLGLLVLATAYPTVTGILSRPRAVADEWYHRHAEEALVVGVYIDEGRALYLYLMLPGVDEPRSYSFAWSEEVKKLAESIQDGLNSEEGRNGVVVPLPFEPSLEREKPLTAHPLPQPKMPDKPEDQQPRPPIHYRQA